MIERGRKIEEDKGKVKNKLKLNLESLQPNNKANNEQKSENLLKKTQDLRGTL